MGSAPDPRTNATLRDTPSFTCIAVSPERGLNALDGEPLPALETLAR